MGGSGGTGVVSRICPSSHGFLFFKNNFMTRNIRDCPDRDRARASGDRFYMPDARCRNGHLSVRYTNSSACVECMRQHQLWYRTGVFLRAESDEEIRLSIQTSVYVVSAGVYVKVGIAESPMKRFSTIETHCPLPAKIERIFGPMPRLDARRIEQKCFAELVGKHERGEWYRCDPIEVISVIQSLLPPTISSAMEPAVRQMRLVS